MTLEAPLVAIVGRPNVGKSALFNRLTRSRRALVERLPGTTRDRQYGNCRWRGREFRVVDTGGLEGPSDDPFDAPIREQVGQALSEAALLLFVVDAASGLTAADHAIAEQLRRSDRPVLVVANKSDRRESRSNVHEAHALGLGDPLLISAYHAEGIGDLLDLVFEALPEAPDEEAQERDPGDRALRIAIVGRPNVGKSSLVNAILGEQRVIVSEVPGATRDSIDSPFAWEGRSMVLVDTAGIRRRGKIGRGAERHSVQQAERAITRADVVVLLIDPLGAGGGSGLTHRGLGDRARDRARARRQQVGSRRTRHRSPPVRQAHRPPLPLRALGPGPLHLGADRRGHSGAVAARDPCRGSAAAPRPDLGVESRAAARGGAAAAALPGAATPQGALRDAGRGGAAHIRLLRE